MKLPTSSPPKRCTSSSANRGQRRSRTRPAIVIPRSDDDRQQQVGGDARPAGRVPVDRARRQVHAGSRCSRLTRQLRFSCGSRAGGEEPARKAALVEPARPVLAEQEGRLRRDVGHESSLYRRPSPRPTGSCDGRPVAGSIRWCCSGPRRSQRRFVLPARGETAGHEPHGRAARQRYVDLAARGEVAAGRDEALPGDQAERLVDRDDLTTPFRSSRIPPRSTTTRPRRVTPSSRAGAAGPAAG